MEEKTQRVKVIATNKIGTVISFDISLPFPVEVMFDNGKTSNFKWSELEELD